MNTVNLSKLISSKQDIISSQDNVISNIWKTFLNRSVNENIEAGSGQNINENLNTDKNNDLLIEKIKTLYKNCSFEVIKKTNSNTAVIKVFDGEKPKAEVIIGKNHRLIIKENYSSEDDEYDLIKVYDNNSWVHYVKQDGVYKKVALDQLSGVSIKASSGIKANGYSASSIINYLYDDIYAKNELGMPTTGKYIKQHVKLINKNNVMDVIAGYYKKTGKDKQNLVTAIFHELGLSAQDRAEMVQHIENCLLDYYESLGVYVNDLRLYIKNEIAYQRDKLGMMDSTLINKLNKKLKKRWEGKQEGEPMKAADGKVNEVSYQGHTGDCWLLASINSIVRSPKGRQILNNSIKVGKDGTVTVHLKGVNKTYSFSKRELYGSAELSTGDMDIRALEKAVEKYMIEEKHDDINGDREITAFKILLGESHVDLYGWDAIWDRVVGISDSYKKKINDPNTICTASVSELGENSGSDVAFTSDDGQKIYKNHAYSVVRADDKYVYLINPWDGGKEIRITFKDFKNIFNSFSDVTL